MGCISMQPQKNLLQYWVRIVSIATKSLTQFNFTPTPTGVKFSVSWRARPRRQGADPKILTMYHIFTSERLQANREITAFRAPRRRVTGRNAIQKRGSARGAIVYGKSCESLLEFWGENPCPRSSCRVRCLLRPSM